MDVSQTRDKLISVLKEIGIENEMHDLFMYILEPLIQDYVTGLLSQTFTNEETEEIVERVAYDERLNEKDIGGILLMEYEKKKGKTMEAEIDEYMNFIADDLKRIFSKYREEVDKLKALSPEERTKKMLEDISGPLDVKLDVE